jgi:hypothetical protein
MNSQARVSEKKEIHKNRELAGKPVIFLSASTGWAVRNFFQTGIVEKLKKYYRIVVFASEPIRNYLISSGLSAGITVLSLENGREPFFWTILRQARKKVYMEIRKSSTETLWEKYTQRPLYQKIGGFIAGIVLKFIKGRRLLDILESVDYKINKSRGLEAVFDEYKPAIYFATHASSYFEESLLRAALAKKVSTVYMVLSWDHLSSKVVLSKKYDRILVWNRLTKSEILDTYPSYSEDQIKIVGIPQYDIYRDKPEFNYPQWCANYGLDPTKKTILFSTMPQVRHNQQHIIIERLLKAIVAGKDLPRDLQVLIKCHPFDNAGLYDGFPEKYPAALCQSTLGTGLPQEKWIPSEKETAVSRDCLYFCAININIFSTVTLEAAYFDKPIIHIAFDPNPVPCRIPCREYYNFEHFKKITRAKAARMVFNQEELHRAIGDYLVHPELQRKERKELLAQYLTIAPGLARDSVVREIEKFRERRGLGRGRRN